MSIYVEPSLWDSVFDVPPRRTLQSPEEAFAQFRRRNPWFMPAVAKLAYRDKVDRGRASVKRIFEELRVQPALELGTDDGKGHHWRLNNSWTSLCARLLIEDYPDLDGFVELRTRKS